MNTIESFLKTIKLRTEILSDLPPNPFINEHVITSEKFEKTCFAFEEAFRSNFPLSDLPDWAETLKPYLIDWHKVLADEDPSALESILTQSTYDKLYLSADKKEHLKFAAEFIENKLFIARLGLIARILTVMAENNKYILQICPEWFVFHHDKIFCNFKAMEKASVKSSEAKLNKYNLGWMHPSLRNREIPKDFNIIEAVTHTFVYFILFTLTKLPPAQTAKDLQVQINGFRAFNPHLSPFLRPFFNSYLISHSDGSHSPLDCWKNFSELLKEIKERTDIEFHKKELDYKGDSIYGRNKKNNDNEDNVITLNGLPSTHALIGVADGVSTASLGSGWLASTTIKKQFQLYNKDWAAKILDMPDPVQKMDDWYEQGELFLKEIFQTAHNTVVEEINLLPELKSSKSDSFNSTMSSTLVATLINGNKGLVAHWGDSRAYLISSGRIIRLTEDHNKLLDLLVKSRKKNKPFQVVVEDASHLTRVVGGCTYNTENNCFDAISPKNQPVPISRFTLKKGEFLLLCSDGLLSGFSDASETEKEKKILSIFNENINNKCREIARKLVRAADDDRGDDNISVAVIRLKTSS